MIYSLTGVLLLRGSDRVVISCAGVGFLVLVPVPVLAMLGNEGEEVSLFTYMDVKDDGVTLYGFSDEEQQSCFKTLITVSGVGPKSALGILSLYSPAAVALAVANGDHHSFCACPGIGPKLAQRIVLELKGKLGAFGSCGAAGDRPVSGGAKAEAAAALVSMGFTRAEAAQCLSGLDGASSAELIREALVRYDERRG